MLTHKTRLNFILHRFTGFIKHHPAKKNQSSLHLRSFKVLKAIYKVIRVHGRTEWTSVIRFGQFLQSDIDSYDSLSDLIVLIVSKLLKSTEKYTLHTQTCQRHANYILFSSLCLENNVLIWLQFMVSSPYIIIYPYLPILTHIYP